MSEKFEKVLYLFFIIAAIAGICYVLSNYAGIFLSIILPFLISGICAHFLSPPAVFLMQKAHFPKWAAHIFVVISFYAALIASSYILVSRLLRELSGLSEYVLVLKDSLPSYIGKAEVFLEEKLHIPPLSKETAELFTSGAESFLGALTQKLATSAPGFLTRVISFVPKALFFTLVTVLATCYFSADLKKIKSFMLFQMPHRGKVFFSAFRVQFFSTASKFLGAYLTLALVTFSELFAGLMFIKREYAFVLAIGITLVDALPFLGCGIVLLPWAATRWFVGDAGTAVGLLVLYIIVATVRQIAEPKILGSFIGLHPLVTLFAMYAGLKTIGFAGVFLFPVTAIIIKNLNDKGVINLFKTPPREVGEHLSDTRSKYKRFRKGE